MKDEEERLLLLLLLQLLHYKGGMEREACIAFIIVIKLNELKYHNMYNEVIR